MDLETLLEEGRRLSRPCLALTSTGDDYVAVWKDRPTFVVEGHEHEHVISILGSRLPISIDGVLHVFMDIDDRGGAAIFDLQATLPAQTSGTKLFAHTIQPLAPGDALVEFGRSDVATWLRRASSTNPADWDVSLTYWNAWLDETRRLPDLYAIVGGWHQSWPEEFWSGRLDQHLLLCTYRDSEPFVEVWQRGEDRAVVQRIT